MSRKSVVTIGLGALLAFLGVIVGAMTLVAPTPAEAFAEELRDMPMAQKYSTSQLQETVRLTCNVYQDDPRAFESFFEGMATSFGQQAPRRTAEGIVITMAGMKHYCPDALDEITAD